MKETHGESTALCYGPKQVITTIGLQRTIFKNPTYQETSKYILTNKPEFLQVRGGVRDRSANMGRRVVTVFPHLRRTENKRKERYSGMYSLYTRWIECALGQFRALGKTLRNCGCLLAYLFTAREGGIRREDTGDRSLQCECF